MANSKPRFTYFAGPGRGEVIRLALSAAKIEYEDVCLTTRDQFVQLINDGKLLFKQVPLLEMDGQNLVGSEPTLRYVCKKYNLMANNDKDQAMVEMLSMGARDMLNSGLTGFLFQATPEEQEAMRKNAVKQCKERYFPVFEQVLAENKSGFLVGDSLTMADITLFDAIIYFNNFPVLTPELANFPHCKAFIDHFSSQPGIKEYLAGPQHHPPPNAHYVKTVRVVLNW